MEGCVVMVTHNLEITNVTLCRFQVRTNSATSWRDQLTFRWDDDDVHFVQYMQLNLISEFLIDL
jgi:hypothetical protein